MSSTVKLDACSVVAVSTVAKLVSLATVSGKVKPGIYALSESTRVTVASDEVAIISLG